MPQVNQLIWEEFLGNFPSTHLLQTSQWADFKCDFGWSVKWITHESPRHLIVNKGIIS